MTERETHFTNRPMMRDVAARGVKIHTESEGQGHPVVLLHGFTGTTRSMAGLALGLRETHQVTRIDLVGHGCSDAPRELEHYSMASGIAQLIETLDALGIVHPHLLGYSMGGRVALAACVAHPRRFASAFVIGASAGLEEAQARAERQGSDAALADRIEGEGVAAFVQHWMALPLFASAKCLGEEALAAAREDRLRNSAAGLANSLRGMGTGAQPPLHAALPGLSLPIRLVVGELDTKFRGIAGDLATRLPNARIEVVEGAGHAAHLEKPGPVARIARHFFREVDAAREAHPGALSQTRSQHMRSPTP